MYGQSTGECFCFDNKLVPGLVYQIPDSSTDVCLGCTGRIRTKEVCSYFLNFTISFKESSLWVRRRSKKNMIQSNLDIVRSKGPKNFRIKSRSILKAFLLKGPKIFCTKSRFDCIGIWKPVIKVDSTADSVECFCCNAPLPLTGNTKRRKIIDTDDEWICNRDYGLIKSKTVRSFHI
jgi:hypothetical protein